MEPKKAVILLSGGLDSAVTFAFAKEHGYACYALTADYGQRHKIEIERAKEIAGVLGACAHKIVQVDLQAFGGSALTGAIPVPDARTTIGDDSEVPGTYVPARNTVLLSLGLAWAEVLHADAIFIGANYVDYSGYPDCRPEYLEAFQALAKLATKAGTGGQWELKIEAPLLKMSKSRIVKLGKELDLDLSLTSSCYNPDSQGTPCGKCEACVLRRKGFAEAGEDDPTVK
ncbi:7-cyano-7-deazaguanine synthase QueC [bacterium]|nr:7-cyano-7-deazaguanine synthase QueC [bacterium]